MLKSFLPSRFFSSLLYLIAVVFLSSCSNQKTSRNYASLAPMAIEDIEDPQKGYYHMPAGINDGEFYLAKSGTSREIMIKIDSKEISFLGEPVKVTEDFKAASAFCSFIEKSFTYSGVVVPANSWRCGIYKSYTDLQRERMTVGQRNWSVDLIICNDCKPVPYPTLSRICPGKYSSWLDPKRDWTDPAMPGYPDPFDDSGNCMHDKPWFLDEKYNSK